MTDVHDTWAEFLNPDIVRTKLVAMGLFMIAHEMLLDSIKDRPLTFFSNGLSADGEWKESDDYRLEILARDPKGKKDVLRGSLAWLREMEIIDEADEAALKEFTDARNVIAHELGGLIGGGATLDFAELFPRLIELVTKIDRWWVVNVDIATNPDFMGQEIDEDGVTPGSLIILQILGRVALGEDEESWELYNKFVSAETQSSNG